MGLRKEIVLLALACLLSGCGKTGNGEKGGNSQQPPEAPGSFAVNTEEAWQEIEPGSIYTGEISVCMPEASGEVVIEEGGVTVDASHTDDGYIMVKCEGAQARLKVQVILEEETYSYDLNKEGEYEVFPLQMGNGLYEIKVFENVEGTTYSQLFFTQIPVDMPDTDRVFVFPSQYVWYTNEKKAVRLSYDLCAELTGDKEKMERIYDYLVNLLSYDTEKAETVEKGYIPDLEEILAAKKGICFDYSALYAAMLRAQNIPVRLVIGNVQPENIYHAWNQVYIDGKWIWKDPTFGPDSGYTETDYTQEREY